MQNSTVCTIILLPVLKVALKKPTFQYLGLMMKMLCELFFEAYNFVLKYSQDIV